MCYKLFLNYSYHKLKTLLIVNIVYSCYQSYLFVFKTKDFY